MIKIDMPYNKEKYRNDSEYREKILEYRRKWYRDNQDKEKKRSRNWSRANREILRVSDRAWQNANRKRVNEYGYRHIAKSNEGHLNVKNRHQRWTLEDDFFILYASGTRKDKAKAIGRSFMAVCRRSHRLQREIKNSEK